MLLSKYRLMLWPMCYYWLMLLPLADVIANCVEDVKQQALTFATSVMADVIAWWQMESLLQGDLADVIAMGQMLL